MAKQVIDSFSGKYHFLSNFHVYSFEWKGRVIPTSEHLFQAFKARSVKDFEYVLAAATPGEAKRRGRSIKKRQDWDRIKIKVMRKVLALKFRAPLMRRSLIETGDALLVEGNTWGDTFWGMVDGHGDNHLGKELMRLRRKLQADTPKEKGRTIEAWTDGACRRTGQGGWAAVFVEGTDVVSEHSGRRPKTTSNRMEMMAVIKALRRAPADCTLIIFSDSQYTVKGINEWVHGWERRNWKTATGEPVKNKAFWKMMMRALARRKGPTTIQWVKGHNGSTYNEMADRLAVGASHSV